MQLHEICILSFQFNIWAHTYVVQIVEYVAY